MLLPFFVILPLVLSWGTAWGVGDLEEGGGGVSVTCSWGQIPRSGWDAVSSFAE